MINLEFIGLMVKEFLPRLKYLYRNKIIFDLMVKMNIKNIMAVPKIYKISINMGVGEAVSNKKYLINSLRDLTNISGQFAVVTKAKKSIASFKIRKGMDIGCKVTLRKDKMYYFLDNLLSIAIPRIRDFRGLEMKSFDGRGNYNFGIKEQIIFPEINYDTVDELRGLDINISTTAEDDRSALLLFKAFKFPFKLWFI